MSETTQNITRSCNSDGEQEPERPERMREWLVRMINTPGRFPGLDWLDPDKTVFKVPWIHAKKRGYNRERDAALFKAWAIHSGKYRDESDPTVWKINFRCAINGLKDIVELKDLQTEDCRVYKVLPSTRKNKRTRKRTPGRSADPYTFPQGSYTGSSPISAAAWQPHNYPPLGGLQVDGSYPSSIGNTLHYQPPCARIPPYSTFSMAATLPPPPQYSESNNYQYNSPIPIPYSEPCTSVYNSNSIAMSSIDIRGESPDSGIVEPSHSMAASPPQSSPAEPNNYSTAITTNSMTDPTCSYPLSVITSTSSTTSDPQIIDVIEELNSVSPHPTSPPSVSSPPPPSHQINVSVFYGTTPVISKNISSLKGCRISFGHTNPPTSLDPVKMEDLFGSMEAEQIYLSSNHPVPQAKELLESMLRGLVIETHNNDVYATALCRCMVHCGTSYYQHSMPLDREKRTKVFDYCKFQTSLEQHVMHCSPLPEPHVIFSLGQLWGPQHPVTLNLISIVVTINQAKNDIQTYLPPFYPSHNLLTTIANPVEVQQSSNSDARADQFLSSVLPC